MIIKLRNNITDKEYEDICSKIVELGLTPRNVDSENHKVLNVIGDTSKVDENNIVSWPGVADVTRIQVPYKLASKAAHPEPTIIDVNGVLIGGDNFTVMAGPCSVESEEQIIGIAKDVKSSGAKILRVLNNLLGLELYIFVYYMVHRRATIFA